MLDLGIVPSFAELLPAFHPCFTAPSFTSFVWLAAGWVLNLRRHTVAETVRAAQAVGTKHISSFHRFFSRGQWVGDEVGLVLVRLVLCVLLDPEQPLVVPIDDTLGRHTGKKIAAASMHRDPLLSTGKRPFFHWGHVWVVLSINVYAFDKTWALPVLVRLYRSKKRCARDQRPFRKTTELARDMVELFYSLIVIWYLRSGQHLRAARLPAMPWYQSKAAPAFSDMLATLRRSSWLERLSVPCANVPTLRKRIRPVLEYAAA
jgi:hypothetical protein